MTSYLRSIDCLDGAVIKMPITGNLEIGNRSTGTLAVSLSYFYTDAVRVKDEIEAASILEDASKFDSSVITEVYFVEAPIGGNAPKGINRQLPRGAKIKVVGGAFTALIWG